VNIHPAEFLQDESFSVDPKLCFLLMPFSEPWSRHIHSVLTEIVEASGYSCKRADDFHGRVVIGDIWRQLNRAAFVVADLTAANPNVYYELGMAHTLGKDVIPLLQHGHDVPFDQRPFRILFYQDDPGGHEALRAELPRWIADLTFWSSPVMMLKGGHVEAFNAWKTTAPQLHLVRENFDSLPLKGANLRDSNLSESSFRDADLTTAGLSGATLVRTDLRGSRLVAADLRSANLSEADLRDANLAGATLADAVMLRPRLDGSTWSDASVARLTIDRRSYERYQHLLQAATDLETIVVE
jgi:uncharacterized protein YjbI with pentapeptide repeats